MFGWFVIGGLLVHKAALPFRVLLMAAESKEGRLWLRNRAATWKSE
jgi:hypothetical protein